MKRGGYQIVDLKNIKIDDESGANIEGIYDLVEGTTKPILFCGINNDGTEMRDVFAQISLRANIFYALLSLENGVATYLKIESDDDVSIITETLTLVTE